MKKLREAALYGGAAVSLSGSLAKRYNECLALLGVAPTSLKNFAIDGVGRSQEIAENKKDDYYLNTGDANVNAIIVSPDQNGKPVHMPSHSFDRDVMRAVFAAYGREIRDITKDSALILQLDQHIDAFFEAFDLLRYDDITIRFTLLHHLDEKQMEQEAFIGLFNRDNNFIDREVHQQILNSAKKYGDLRKRKLRLDPIKLKVGSFYTRAFGGVFVLRDFIKPILIFEDEKVFKKAIDDIEHDVLLFHIDHDELIDQLVDHLIVELDVKDILNKARYKRIKKHLFTKHINKTEHPVQEILDSEILFKRYFNKIDITIQKKISGAELFIQKSSLGSTLKVKDYVEGTVLKALYKPHSSLEKEQRELIWKLLTKIAPIDPVHLYWYDKEQFYKTYATWEASYQDWVITRITENNKKYTP